MPKEALDLLVELSDLIDMRDYTDEWEDKAQKLITQIANLIKNEYKN